MINFKDLLWRIVGTLIFLWIGAPLWAAVAIVLIIELLIIVSEKIK